MVLNRGEVAQVYFENQVMLVSNIRLRPQMISHFTQHQTASIHYLLLDRGENVMVCFHGYDENAGAFEMIGEFLPAGYSLLSIDLPFHGETRWTEGLDFDAKACWQIVSDICKKHQKKTTDLIVGGFSLGGRVALSFFHHRPSDIARLILFAPDGLHYNFWYRVVTGTTAGRQAFRFTVRHPAWLLFTIRLGRKLRIINQSVFKFTSHYLQDYDGRKLLFDRWVITRKLSVPPSVLKSTIRQFKVPVLLVYGSYDRIVPPVTGHGFCRGLSGLCTIEEIPCGHLILQQKNRKYLFDIIEKQKAAAAQAFVRST